MIIVLVVDSFADKSNGTSMTAARFASALEKRGHSVRVVAPFVQGSGFYPVKERYIPLVTEIAKAQHMVFGKPDVKVLEQAFLGADIVHLFLPFRLEQVAVQVAKKMGVPYMAAFHLQPEHITYNIGLQKFALLNRFIFWLFKRRFYRHIAHIHCPSQLIKDELERAGYGGKKYVISNGFDPKFKPADPSSTPLDKLIHITMVGRYSKEKRQDLIIKAIAQNPYKDKIKLHLLGVGPLESTLKKQAKVLPNAVDFRFLPLEELIKVLHQSTLYIHAAEVEGEAIAALEAISCGIVPIIADSKVSATRQFALDHRSLFRAGDASDLSEKITYWIERTQERDQASKLYAKSAQNYTLESTIAKAIAMYEEVISDFQRS
ncbi:glycosyltransferase [Helicobacter canis]|uniref:Type 1 capsular polysaccharide biosynthesis protein J n=1 Tax=Helicobacter canis TaxID=29419 RepID=A0A377J2R3_9HELI|nr:glycosyltransferase [Helicobacter canis]STO96514.1 type 1 capsular polysaccharide biosynthesis protein J [Helicobacter canis]